MEIIYLPEGTKNLRTLFPTLPWSNIEEYYIQSKNNTDEVIVTSPGFRIKGCVDDIARVHFMNYLGFIDSVDLKVDTIEKDTASTEYKKGQSTDKTKHNISRTSVVSNDFYSCSTIVEEDDISYYDELLTTPLAWLEHKGIEGQPDSYLPIVIDSIKSPKLKIEDRYYYEVIVQFKLSHEKIIQRG